MSFLLVDQILTDEPGVQITGFKHIYPDEPYVVDAKPMFMPALIGETLGQLAAWSVIHAGDYQYRPVAGVARQVTWHQPVYPGDTLQLTANILRWDNQAVEYQALATVKNQPVFAIGNALGPMLPMADFIDDATIRAQYQQLKNPRVRPAPASMPAVTTVDQVTHWQPGITATAIKTIDPHSPYFADHFPRKPVLPLTLLLQMQTELAEKLFNQRLHTFTRVKMREFVKPGSELTLAVRLKTHTPLMAMLTASIDNKIICTAEALFV